jgi:hypothetical protein
LNATTKKQINVAKVITYSGCAPVIAEAFVLFFDRWEPHSKTSRNHSIFSLVAKIIDPAWQELLTTYPESDFLAELQGIAFSKVAKSDGFFKLSEIIRQWIKHLPKSLKDSNFRPTLESLFGFSQVCASKGPLRFRKKKGEELYKRPTAQFCEFCGEDNELFSFMYSSQDLGEAPKTHLSSKYCKKHRSKSRDKLTKCGDKAWEPEYTSAKRKRELFEVELERLKRLSGPTRDQPTEDIADQFAILLLRRLNIFPDELKLLRNEAQNLVVDRKKLSDRKKHIILLLVEGKKQKDIAIELRVSKQVVSKNIQSIPLRYRLDISRDTVEALKMIDTKILTPI